MAQKMHPAEVRKKKRRRRRRTKGFLIILCVLAVLTFVLSIVYTFFQLKQMEVFGNEFTPTEDVIAWIKQDDFSDNTLYVWLKFNNDRTEQISSVESTEVKLISPNSVVIQIHEKEMAGRLDYNGQYIYFYENGIASLISSEVLEGVPHITGIELGEDIVLGETLSVENEEVFRQINELSGYIDEHELDPDLMLCDDSGITLCFGNIKVMLGTDGYKEKTAQISPLLEKLNEEYKGQAGTFHMENYKAGNTTIRFVPDEAE